MDLCMYAERRTGTRVSKRWWDQDRVDVEGVHKADQEGQEETYGMETATD